MTRHLAAAIVLLAPLSAVASELEVLRAGEPANYTVPIPPGQLFTFNFVVGAADVSAKFQVAGPRLVVSTLTHPESDVVRDRASLSVDCPGLAEHPMEVSSAAEPMSVGTLHLNPTEIGHFGYAFRNVSSQPATMRLAITSSKTLGIAFVGMQRGEVVPLRPQP